MKVFAVTLVVVLLATFASAGKSRKVDTDMVDETLPQTEESSEAPSASAETSAQRDKEVHKRGIFYNEALGHFAAHAPHASLWPKNYAAHYGYQVRLPGSAHSTLKYPIVAAAHIPHKTVFATAAAPVHATVLRPGGALVSSYNVNYPRYRVKPAYSVPHVAPVQTFVPAPIPVQPVHAVPAQPSYETPVSQHHYFQHTLVEAPKVPVFSAVQPAPIFPAVASFSPQPEYPTYSFAPEPQIPALPAIPAIQPALPPVNTSPPVQTIFPVNFQPPRPQPPQTFISIPVGVDFSNFAPAAGTPAPNTGSAVASPQIPASLAPPSPSPQPELPPVQSPPTQTPWRPLYTAPPTPLDFQRPSNTLQPPYGVPAEGYLPPAPGQQSQQQQQIHFSNNLFDELSDAEIEQLLAQAKHTPHHSQHAHRQEGLVYQHHY